MSTSATIAASVGRHSTRAATATVRSARPPHGQWLEAHRAELLPVDYFHVVFTLPAAIAEVALQNKALLYDMLFRTSAETMREIAADPKHLVPRSAFCRCCTLGGRT